MVGIAARIPADDTRQADRLTAAVPDSSTEAAGPPLPGPATLSAQSPRINLAEEFAARFGPAGGIELETYHLAISNPFLFHDFEEPADAE